MAQRKKKSERDVEKTYPAQQFVAKLRRLADCIEQEKRFRIQVSGERVSVPPDALINIEHEREGRTEEIEFQLEQLSTAHPRQALGRRIGFQDDFVVGRHDEQRIIGFVEQVPRYLAEIKVRHQSCKTWSTSRSSI